ncbi:MAG: PfkB family carbohydrate kinase [Calditrichaceae bacterium]
MRNIDVLCVGVTSYDFYFYVDHHPGQDEKTTADSFLSCGGGPAANAAVTIAKMGLSVAFAGYLGNNAWGDQHFWELKQAGVQTDLIIRGENPTPVSAVFVKPDGRRSLVNYQVADAALNVNDIDFSMVKPKVILFDGHEPQLSLKLIERAKIEDIITVLDAGSLHEGTHLLHDKVNYLVCSEKFAEQETDESSMVQALELLSQKNRNIVITMGKKGLIWKRGNENGKLQSFKIVAVDTTGAGDVFHGAFAFCLAKGTDWHETLKFSSAASAVCCTRAGARTSIPTLYEVTEFLKINS